MNKVFVFSTRYSFVYYPKEDDYKTTGKYLFSEDRCEKWDFDTSILFKTDEKIFSWFWNLDVAHRNKEAYRNNFIKELQQDTEPANQFWQNAIIDKKIELSDSQKQILIKVIEDDYIADRKIEPSYYCQIKNKEIYAVNPNDKHTEAQEWIKCLLNSFAKNENEVFLLLHDKDIYQNGEPFKVLDEAEIKKLTDRKNVNILVYQHEKNPVTDILRSCDLKDIEGKIESVFYKYPLKKALLAYVDALFYPKEQSKVEEKKKAVIEQYKKHITEYAKIKDLPDLSKKENLEINLLEKTGIDKLYNWINFLS